MLPGLLVLFVAKLYVLRYTLAMTGDLSVKGMRNKALFGYSFRNISGLGMKGCLEQCLSECLCLAFQICDNHCQLCSTNENITSSALRHHNGCTAYKFKKRSNLELASRQCADSGCRSLINCCLTSKPCLNGGICVPRVLPGHRRFTCQCTSGYRGNRCEKKVWAFTCAAGYKGHGCQERITSCRGYYEGSLQVPSPGIYTIFIESSFVKVYCEFDSEGMAWTLVQSSQLGFTISRPFSVDLPLNEALPSWDQYRLSREKMNAIQQVASKWRITCKYDKDGLHYKDYIRATLASFNVMTYIGNPGECVEVELINIRGHECRNCRVYLAQSSNYQSFSIQVSFLSSENSCNDFYPGDVQECHGIHNKWITKRENNFGWYKCVNPQHRCSSSKNATTQIWFGE